MEVNNQNDGRNHSQNNNRKILFIVCIYLFLTLSSKFSKDSTKHYSGVKEKLLQLESTVVTQDVADSFTLEDIFSGVWLKHSNVLNSDDLLGELQGKFQMKMSRLYGDNGNARYRVAFRIFDGYYIDNGIISFFFYIEDDNFSSIRQGKMIKFFYNATENTTLSSPYEKERILIQENTGIINLNTVQFTFSFNADQSLHTNLDLSINKQVLTMNVQGKQNQMTKMLIFASLLFVLSGFPFSGIMRIMKDIIQLRDNARRYSFATVVLTSMWDATLCIIAFLYAFSDQESLMLFIVPAFLLCLLFTNIQPRLMISIFQQLTNSTNIRDIICKFNLIHYGSLLLIYPILIFTNLNWSLFIGMSCIIFPQIYTNGMLGHRPELTSGYYIKYLLARFIIIFYLKCFPFNIFQLEPNYILSAICLLIIGFQYFLLYVQKVYGSKRVIPAFLLEPVFNYKLQEQINIEENIEVSQCSICLMPLHSIPPENPNELQFDPPFKMMKTPCNHNYHSRCLMVWMKVKMECPQCRTQLPPYQ